MPMRNVVMLSDTIKSIVLSIIILNVVILSAIAPFHGAPEACSTHAFLTNVRLVTDTHSLQCKVLQLMPLPSFMFIFVLRCV